MTSSHPVPSGRSHAPEHPGARLWITVLVLGLVGQLAWTVENMYLNVFVYETITADPTVIAAMVALSAIAATAATLFIGAWSDRLGRRRVFIAVGYVAWGLCTAAFGLLAPQNGAVAAPYVLAAIIGVVALDCVMSVFGSGANDAAFGAWVTEATTDRTRGRVDGVLAIMPLMAMLLVFGLLDGLTQAGEWRAFFAIVGAATAVAGLGGWLLVRDLPSAPGVVHSPSIASRLADGFRPSAIRDNAGLYISLAIWLVVGTSSQVFLPYVIIYLEYWLRADSYALILGCSLLAASAISVIGGRVMDRVGKRRVLIPATALFAVGLVLMFFARDTVLVIVAASLALGGMMLAIASVSATVRDQTPIGRAGVVQGLRMVTAIMIPMVVGPFLGAWVIAGAGQTYVDLGVEKPVPGPQMFLAAAAVLLLVPLLTTVRRRIESRVKIGAPRR